MNLKTYYTAAALIVGSFTSYAQTEAKRIQVGLSALTSVTFVNGDDRSHFKSKGALSYGIGGDVYYELSERMQINSGLEWFAANWDYRDQTAMWPTDVVDGEFAPGHGGNYFRFEVTENYIGLPLLLHYKPSSAVKSKLFLVAGIKLLQRITLEGNVSLYLGHQPWRQYDFNDELFGERTAFKTSGVMGFGFELPAGRSKFSISPMYEFDFNKIRNEVTSDIVGNGSGSFLGLRFGWMPGTRS